MVEMKNLAEESIRKLLDLAFEMFHKDRELSDRYVELAFKISMKTGVRIPKDYRFFICRKCKVLLIPGYNCRVRLQPRREPHIVVTCLECGRMTRYLLRGLHKRR